MKVLHICQNFNTSLFTSLFDEINSLGINQTVFYPYINSKEVHSNINDDITVVIKKSVLPIFRHFFLIRAFFNFYNLNKSVRISDFDVIHCHTFFNDGIVGLIISVLYKKKLVITIRQSDIEIYKKKIWLRPYVSLFKLKKAKFISLSPSIKKYFSQLQSQVIGNGISSDFFSSPVLDKIKRNNKIELIYIGRIIKRKNIDAVINLVEKYKDKYNLTVIGLPPTKSKWSNDVLFKLNSLSNIEYFPFKASKEIIQYLDKSDVFILPSFKETFGIVYLEAMSRGIPVVYMKGTAIDSLFEKEVGIALTALDSNHIKDSLDYIEQNYSTISNNCRAYSKEYNWLSIAKKNSNFYHKS
jgi:glycosyltransferase involved in cell wall biosynthesis